jgi:fructan beta-fructosidase
MPFAMKTDSKLSSAIVFLVLTVLEGTACAPVALAAERRPDVVIADFEGIDYGDWTTTGEAFGKGPAQGTLPGQMPVEGFLGKGLVNSFFHGDGTTGRLKSPSFKIERNYITFLVGGGGFPGKTCINLLVDGKVARTATGPNTQPGGSERLERDGWDVRDLAGKAAVIEIVDDATAGWGHINVDQIVASDRSFPMPREARREITIEKRYLHLPVKTGATKRIVNVQVDGQLVRQFEIELAETTPDWWAFLDVAALRGKKAELSIRDRLPEEFAALDKIEQSDRSIRDAKDLYREPLRPQFHFSSMRGWNNDPNGLVFHEGEYHLFYQHNPYGWNWGNMHWGHAVSRDLVRWKELGEAIYPDALGTAFSGSAVVDKENTTGFAQGNEPAIVCMYTAAGDTSLQSRGVKFSQCLAYSTDRGRTWKTYDKNPVLPHIIGGNRDPKAIWYAPEKKWVLALYLDGETYGLFSSPDMKQWQKLCDVVVKGDSECPEFFEIPVAGKSETRWVFYGGKGTYLIGRFDGRKFSPESGPHILNLGNCFYASQTFNNIPAEDGRRILVPWGQVEFPGMPFNQMMGFPIELTLHSTADGLRLFAQPAREIKSLWGQTRQWRDVSVRPGENLLSQEKGQLFDIAAEIRVKDAAELGFVIRGVRITYDAKRQELVCQDKRAALKPMEGKLRFRILVDRGSVEIFANDGHVYMPMRRTPASRDESLAIFVKGGSLQVISLDVRDMKSAWEGSTGNP